MKLFTLILLTFSVSALAQFSGVRTVCSSGCDFTTLTGTLGSGGAFANINTSGLNGNLVLEIRENITESGATALNAWTETPLNSNYTLTIRPDGSTMRTLTIAAATTADLIRLNGADRVIIDGRDPSNATIDYTNRYLTLNSSSTNNTVVTLRFTGDASNNTVRSCIVEGRVSSTTLGIITFNATSALTNGNNSNLVEYCDIKNSTANPLNGIFAIGSSASIQNSSTIVRNNRIYDFFSSTTDHNGIHIGNFNTQWTISGNSIYQTGNRAFTSNNRSYSAIRLDPTASGSGFTIDANYIGGTTFEAGGSTWQLTAFTNGWARVRLIFVNTLGTALPTTISNNTLRKVTANQRQSSSSGEGVVVGILVAAGNANISSNLIGDSSGGLSSSSANNANVGSAHTLGVSLTGSAYGDISSNQIDNLVTSTQSTNVSSATSTAVGISINKTSGTQNMVIERNIIGSTDGVVRITTNNNTSGLSITVTGISITASTSSTFTVRRNFIRNARSIATGVNSFIRGISFSGGGIANIGLTRNVVENLSSAANNTATTGAATGMYITTPASDLSISQNFIFAIQNSNAVSVYGLAIDNLGSGATVANNMITLGESTTSDTRYIGLINLTSIGGTINWYFNSVVITGAGNVTNTQNTFAYYRGSGITTPTVLRNNVLMNTRGGGGKHYSLGSEQSTAFDSDFNSIYAGTSTNTTLWLGADYDFTNWQTQTSGDANSLNFDATPDFQDVSTGNLRIFYDGTPKTLEDAGTAAGGITEDIDGARRLGLAPDIGACEVYNGWTGLVSSDWNSPGNWSYLVPTCSDAFSTNVKVLETDVIPGTFQPEIGAYAASFVSLVLGNDAALKLTDNTSLLTQCAGSSSPDLLLVEGSLEFSDGVSATSARIDLLGDLENNGSINQGIGEFRLLSNLNQYIRGITETTFFNLSLQGGGNKETEQNFLIENEVAFSSGILVSGASELPTFLESATHTGSSDASYIDGPVAKRFDNVTSFTFPSGKLGSLRPATVTTVNTDITTFTTEYFPVSAIVTFPDADISPLIVVSDREYWMVTRSGTANASVTLTWNSNSYVSADAGSPGRDDLRVARYDGSDWTDEGGNSISGTQSAGSVTSDVITSFSPLTLASSSPANPLPVELLFFVAQEVQGNVLLQWKTASELNNDRFIIEHSSSGTEFKALGEVTGNGTVRHSTDYSFWDYQPALGQNYYVLKQVDFDGTRATYGPVFVEVNGFPHALTAFPNPVSRSPLTVLATGVESGSPVDLEVFSISGQPVHSLTRTSDPTGVARFSLETIGPPGVYIIKAHTLKGVQVIKVLVIE
jgi:hypothetical protein